MRRYRNAVHRKVIVWNMLTDNVQKLPMVIWKKLAKLSDYNLQFDQGRRAKRFLQAMLIASSTSVYYMTVFLYYDLFVVAILSAIQAVLFVVLASLVARSHYASAFGHIAVTIGFTSILALVWYTQPFKTVSFVWMIVPALFCVHYVSLLAGLLWSAFVLGLYVTLYFLPRHQFPPFPAFDGLFNLLMTTGLLAFVFLLICVMEFDKRRYIKMSAQLHREVVENQETILRTIKTRNRLISVLTHDLRNPLANIRTLLNLFSKGKLEAGQRKLMLTKLRVSVATAVRTLDDLLAWAGKNRSDQIKVHRDEFLVADVARHVVQFCQPLADAKDVKLIVSPTAHEIITTDEHILEIVLRNLVSNAIKFSHPGASVLIDVDKREESLFVRVTDFGTGIPERIRGKLFNSFVTSLGTRNEQGTGFGLVMSREFIEKLNGSLFIDDSHKNGTRMCIALPLKKKSPLEIQNEQLA